MYSVITTSKYLEEVHTIPQSIWPPKPEHASSGMMISPTKTGAFVKYALDESSVFVKLPETIALRLVQVCEAMHTAALGGFGDCYPIVPFAELFQREEIKAMKKELLLKAKEQCPYVGS